MITHKIIVQRKKAKFREGSFKKSTGFKENKLSNSTIGSEQELI